MTLSVLDGFRVLDLTQYLAGPYATLVLAELGADVVKIEKPDAGDDARAMDPQVGGASYPFGMPNRSKRSIVMDLKADRGRELFLGLARQADLVIENFRPGVMQRLGLGYDTLKEANEGLLYCSISGYGQSGPYRGRPALDIMIQGMTGLMRMTGEPGGRPVKVGIAVNDLIAGATATYSILAAELARRVTGQGQYIDVSLLDSGLAWMFWESGAYFGNGEVPVPTGSRHRRIAPYQAFRTADGYVTIGAASERLWRRLAESVLRHPEWVADPRFATNTARVGNADVLAAEIEAITRRRRTEEWLADLDEAGVPGGPVFGYEEALRSPQVAARGLIAEVEHPTAGTMRTIGPPTRFSGMRFAVRGPAPLLGQHTREVLHEYGLTTAQIDELLATSVVVEHQRRQ
ncbi:CaiB/BaiF CoA transferase family protein [Actinomadura macra]|uniref:CaiB/BaiF CoA transferase family protein n=1 Tax=Actinomadura macra TaxID=46164 RepID=UPI000836C552|nr:CoA transferase [Actinomadura macra]